MSRRHHGQKFATPGLHYGQVFMQEIPVRDKPKPKSSDGDVDPHGAESHSEPLTQGSPISKGGSGSGSGPRRRASSEASAADDRVVDSDVLYNCTCPEIRKTEARPPKGFHMRDVCDCTDGRPKGEDTKEALRLADAMHKKMVKKVRAVDKKCSELKKMPKEVTPMHPSMKAIYKAAFGSKDDPLLTDPPVNLDEAFDMKMNFYEIYGRVRGSSKPPPTQEEVDEFNRQFTSPFDHYHEG